MGLTAFIRSDRSDRTARDGTSRAGGARAAGAAAAALTLAATSLGIFFIAGAEDRRVKAEIDLVVLDARSRAREALGAHMSALEARAQGAGAHPRLVAALSAPVDRATLRDLFYSEPWWRPFRERFRGFHLAAGDAALPLPVGATAADADRPDPAAAVEHGGSGGLAESAAPLVRRARDGGGVASAVVTSAGRALALVAVPIALPKAGPPPVLLMEAPLDAAALGAIAERAGGAAALSDGRQLLVGAGPPHETARLRGAIGREDDGPIVAREPRSWAAGVTLIAPSLWLVTHIETGPVALQAASAFAAFKVAVCAIGAGLFLAALVAIRRSGRGRAAAVAADEGGPLGRYVLLCRLGGGAVADVHLALSIGDGGFRRPCVVKRLRPELARNPGAVARFTEEAALASSLVHANIVPVFDFGRAGDQPFVVQEYVPGRGLGRLVARLHERGRALSPALVVYIGLEALAALRHAHERTDPSGRPLGLVHHDLSPDAVMISLRGEVKLVDFAVAKTREARVVKTEAGAIKGNLAFMSPEQAQGLAVDARADLFSLALVLYHSLVGEPLYGVRGGYDLLVRAAAGPDERDRTRLAALPAPFDAALARALAASCEERFPNAAAFAAALVPLHGDEAPRLAALMDELFGEELRLEQRPLAEPKAVGPAALVEPPARRAAGA